MIHDGQLRGVDASDPEEFGKVGLAAWRPAGHGPDINRFWSPLRLLHLSLTDEGVAVGGAFDSDTATGMMPAAQRVAGVLTSWRS